MAETKGHEQVDITSCGEAAQPYEVGYCKPPRHTQFKPGQSGNPRRGKARKRSPIDEISKILAMPIIVKEGEKTRRVSAYEAAALQLRKMALSGNIRALERILDLSRELARDEDPTADLTVEDERLLAELLAVHLRKLGREDES
ncbi:DUF5681 domain-containing protein [Sphingomonas profundi]|uniref:DUF5681 domain-containing protein n=1 Tax=Alterirhizorhabdus profundi TaxID=2681549 RepID=UPI0012E7CE59|nr:DUF5681 domain-containing protein [Sphingomonas profundi]